MDVFSQCKQIHGGREKVSFLYSMLRMLLRIIHSKKESSRYDSYVLILVSITVMLMIHHR